MAELMEMVQNDADSSRPASPRAIQSALAIAKPEKVCVYYCRTYYKAVRVGGGG